LRFLGKKTEEGENNRAQGLKISVKSGGIDLNFHVLNFDLPPPKLYISGIRGIVSLQVLS
jgi:hypothetical protein